MDFQGIAFDLARKAFPKAATAITFLEKSLPYLAKARPLVEAAIEEGPKAFAAAKAAAPELGQAIENLTKNLFNTNTPERGQLEIVTKKLLTPHRMTPEEERHWMDSFTSNQQYGGN